MHELRRRNEGDDVADSPGYALNLVRVPISVLPGKRTFRGYAAEITLTARLQLSPALLPTTFRNLVINDVVDQLSLPITRITDAISRDAVLSSQKVSAEPISKQMRKSIARA